jgi:hypothetical protein
MGYTASNERMFQNNDDFRRRTEAVRFVKTILSVALGPGVYSASNRDEWSRAQADNLTAICELNV